MLEQDALELHLHACCLGYQLMLASYQHGPAVLSAASTICLLWPHVLACVLALCTVLLERGFSTVLQTQVCITFSSPSSSKDLCCDCRSDRGTWQQLMRRGMARDFSWNKAAEQYEQIFEWAKTDLPYCG